jgi:maltooligosyltrehalose synthase
MDEGLHLSKVQIKCLQTFSAMTRLHDACQKLVVSPSQEAIDEIAELATTYQSANEEFQGALMDFLKNVAEPSEEMQITSSQTDIGYKIN